MKTEVYSWRLSPQLKRRLEAAAREEGVSMSALIERMATDWLAGYEGQVNGDEQRRLHEAVRACYGSLEGAGSSLSEQVSMQFGEIVQEKHARDGSD